MPPPRNLLGVGLTLPVLHRLTLLLTLWLAEALAAPRVAPLQPAVLPGHRQHGGRQEGQEENLRQLRHLGLHLWQRS